MIDKSAANLLVKRGALSRRFIMCYVANFAARFL